MKRNRGFTLIELIVTIAIVGILAAITSPMWMEWLQNARYREAARNIASTLRDARARAIARNLEYDVAFNLATDRYSLREGNRAYETSTWTAVSNNIEVSNTIDLRGLGDCSDETATNFTIQFNPNGTGSGAYVCVVDNQGNRKYRAGSASTTTTRIVVQKWNPVTSSWQ